MAITVGIYGIGGMYNYGCEAIIRGTVAIIRSLEPESKIIYFSQRADEDRTQAGDLDLDIIQIAYRPTITGRFINRILRALNIKYRLPFWDYKLICDESDVVFSIGGDIYTIPDHIRGKKSYEYYNSLVQFGEYVKQRRKKLVIFGASIGPFGDCEKAKQYYLNHLKKADLLVCRESNTIDYLKANGIYANIAFYPDPAFFVVGEQSPIIEKGRYIGINLSPLSLSEIYGKVTTAQKQKLADLICKIAKATNKNILLIPHVISPVNPMDNDLSFLSEIFKLVDDDIKENVKLLDHAGGFIQTKNYLRKCDVVVAARMHCAINAMCEAVPSILLSYSEKSKGIAKFIYGNENWVLPLSKMDTDLVDKIKQMLWQREEIHNYLINKIKVIHSSEVENDALSLLLKLVKQREK